MIPTKVRLRFVVALLSNQSIYMITQQHRPPSIEIRKRTHPRSLPRMSSTQQQHCPTVLPVVVILTYPTVSITSTTTTMIPPINIKPTTTTSAHCPRNSRSMAKVAAVAEALVVDRQVSRKIRTLTFLRATESLDARTPTQITSMAILRLLPLSITSRPMFTICTVRELVVVALPLITTTNNLLRHRPKVLSHP